MDEPAARQVGRAQRGDPVAFDELADRWRRVIAAWCFLRTGDRETAEELAQEVLLKAWQGLPALREVGAFPGWLAAITRRECASWHRKAHWSSAALEEAALGELPDSGPTPAQRAADRERWLACRRLLLELPRANALPLLLHVLGGCPYARLAELLEVSQASVESRIFRARRELARRLDAWEESLPSASSEGGTTDD